MPAHGAASLSGIVCDDRPTVRRTLAALVTRGGFAVVSEADSFSSLTDALHRWQPHVVVVSLPLVGMNGLVGVRDLRRQAPACQVVLLSLYDCLVPEALEAGALALLPEENPQALLGVLKWIAATQVVPQLPGQRRQPVGSTPGVLPSAIADELSAMPTGRRPGPGPAPRDRQPDP